MEHNELLEATDNQMPMARHPNALPGGLSFLDVRDSMAKRSIWASV
jgi:hypothetical protein